MFMLSLDSVSYIPKHFLYAQISTTVKIVLFLDQNSPSYGILKFMKSQSFPKLNTENF